MSSNGTYSNQLIQLLPNGKIWEEKNNPESKLYKLIQGLSDEFERVDARLHLLIDECDPRTVNEMASNWAKVLNCTTDQIFSKFISTSEQTEQYYYNLAVACGYTSGVTFTHYAPFTCKSLCTNSLYIWPWCSTVTVNANVPGEGNSEILIELFNKTKQLHVVFTYNLGE
jgi:uncharacterized protein YmfQ (DUF2313 family)